MQVLVISHEPISDRMAGPAIRSWEIARTLAKTFDVTLAAPRLDISARYSFQPFVFSFHDNSSVKALEQLARADSDVVFACGHLALRLPFLTTMSTPWIADAYIPIPVESLAWHSDTNMEEQISKYRNAWKATKTMALYADLIVCASNRQRDFWLGIISAFGRMRPERYSQDPTLSNLVAIAPFGCPLEPPQNAPKEKADLDLEPKDKLILWGGGIWNWFDPLTLLRAMPQVLRKHPRTHLLFLGSNHPDSENIPEMQRARETRALVSELELGANIIWGDWVPYNERGAYLLTADLGVSLHNTGIEPYFAFRTRLLDSIWAGLPMVLSVGDVLGDELAGNGLGYAVSCNDKDQVANAIISLLNEPDAKASRRSKFEILRKKYHWDKVVEPIVQFCQSPYYDLDKQQANHFISVDMEQTSDRIHQLERKLRLYEANPFVRLTTWFRNFRLDIGK